MGTLGCINDMLQRDKENRELRKLNRDRMKEHHKYLVGKGKNADLPFVWLEIEDDVIFSDNCFDLTSEETKTICIRKEDVLSGKVLSADNVRKTLKVRSLRDTYEQ